MSKEINLSDNMICTIREVLRMHCKDRGKQYPCRYGSPEWPDWQTDCFEALQLFDDMAAAVVEVRRWDKSKKTPPTEAKWYRGFQLVETDEGVEIYDPRNELCDQARNERAAQDTIDHWLE